MGDGTRGVPRQVGEFHGETGKARAGPMWRRGPIDEAAEQPLHDLLRRAREIHSIGVLGRESLLVLCSKDGCQQAILALEVMVERALGDPTGRSDLVDSGAKEALPAEQPMGFSEDMLTGLLCGPGH